MLGAIGRWLERRRAVRHRWQADARALVAADKTVAYYDRQRRAARAPSSGERDECYH